MFICIRQQDLQQSSESRLGPSGGSLASQEFPVVWGIVFVCGLKSVTTVYETAEDCNGMPTNQKSANSDFFLTDENDGYNSYGLKSAVRENYI